MPSVDVVNISKSGVTLLAGDALRAWMDREASLPSMTEELLPHIALLCNESRKQLVLFVVTWLFTTGDKNRSKYVRVFETEVASGSKLLISSIGQAAAFPGATLRQPIPEMTPRHTRLVLDAVLFADGTTEGIDSTGAVGDLLFQFRLFGSLVRGYETGVSESAMFLEARSAATMHGGGRSHFRRKLAEDLLREYENQGLDGAVFFARQSLASLPAIRIDQ
ncbi:MAG: hypothetical protein U0R19_29890 [Bryobacteraceae bacterium]